MMDSLFDLLDREELPPQLRPIMPAESSGPMSCKWCGATEPNAYLLRTNHGDWEDPHPIYGAHCIAQFLTLNHTIYWVKRVAGSVQGEPPDQCCYGPGDVHGRRVTKPTTAQLADHLHHTIDYAKKTWGTKADEYMHHVMTLLLEHKIFPIIYSLEETQS